MDGMTAPFRGLTTMSATVASGPAPTVTVADIMRTMNAIYAAYPRGIAAQLRHGAGFAEQLGVDPAIADAVRLHGPLTALMGIPLVPDDRLPDGEWLMLAADGTVLRRSAGAPRSLVEYLLVDPVEAYPDPVEGDVLDRIDAAVDAWELDGDAYRWSP